MWINYEFQWRDESVGDACAILIWDFEIMPSPAGPWVPHDDTADEEDDSRVKFPLVSYVGSCNCTRGAYGNVIVIEQLAPGPRQDDDVDDDDDHDEDDHDAVDEVLSNSSQDEEHDTHYDTICIYCSGCTYARFQETIEAIRSKGPDMRTIPMQFKRESNNIKDRNAISIEAQLDSVWKPVGYVGKGDIQRVTQSLTLVLLKEIYVERIKLEYIPAAGKQVFRCWCSATKEGRWPPKSNNYVYNQRI